MKPCAGALPTPPSLWPLALLLVGCSEQAPDPPNPKPKPRAEAPAVQAKAPPVEKPVAAEGGEDAAEVMKRYYALIGAGNYAEAYGLREPAKGAPSAEAFAENFRRYAEYRATVGTPSEPVESGGWLYVEVPVQTYGRMKDGLPLASGGTVTLRRRPAGDWRIFTKG